MMQHFVTFLSPGTFVAEQTTRPIDSWDVEAAKRMADGIVERYGATPYAFYFTTRERGDADLDSKETKRSPNYFLGGEVETLRQVKARNDDSERILISNMECNGFDRVLVNRNSWKSYHRIEEGDVVLDYTPPKKPEPVEQG
jgi:hypothetical protein